MASPRSTSSNLCGLNREKRGRPAKAHIVYDGGHYQYRRNSVARNVTDWFDRYLGSVR
jgi:hypothetical protein